MKIIIELDSTDLVGSAVNKERNDLRMADFSISKEDYSMAQEIKYKDSNGGIPYFKRPRA